MILPFSTLCEFARLYRSPSAVLEEVQELPVATIELEPAVEVKEPVYLVDAA